MYIVFNIHPCCVKTWVEGVESSIQGQGDCDLSVNRRKHEDSNSLLLLSNSFNLSALV